MTQLHQVTRYVLLFPVLLLSATGAADVPMTPWGDPNIDGLWDYRTLTPLQRPAAFSDQAEFTPVQAERFRQATVAGLDVDNRNDDAAVDIESAYNQAWYDWGTRLGDLRTSLITSPDNGRLPPLTDAARRDLQAQYKSQDRPSREMVSLGANANDFRPDGPEALGLSERCLVGFNAGPPLIPSAYNNNLRIVQTPDHVLLVTEMIHTARVVQMDGRPYMPDHISQWGGDARGHWDGQTLVVETRNFSDKLPTFQLPYDLENPRANGAVGSANNMTLIERFTRTGPDTLRYEYTLTDQTVFTSPFTAMINLRRNDAKMFEYACHEGNYAMLGMLRGARATASN